MRKIGVAGLEIVFAKIIEHLKLVESSGEIVIEEDSYQFIPPDMWSVFKQDIALSGSLFDDIDCLQKLTLDPDHPTMFIDYDRLAYVLLAISQKYNPPLE